MSTTKYIIIFLFLTAALASCGGGTAVFGDPKKSDFREMSVAAIKRGFLDNIDKPVVISGKFLSVTEKGFVEKRDTFMIKTEFGDVLIAVPEGSYDKKIAEMKTGRQVRVYGTVSVATPPGRSKTILTILVD